MLTGFPEKPGPKTELGVRISNYCPIHHRETRAGFLVLPNLDFSSFRASAPLQGGNEHHVHTDVYSENPLRARASQTKSDGSQASGRDLPLVL